MSKGGVDNFVRDLLRRIAAENPDLTFRRVCEEAYIKLPQPEFQRMMATAGGKGKFVHLQAILGPDKVVETGSVIKALAIDIMHIYAGSDDKLRALMEADKSEPSSVLPVSATT